LSVAVQAAGTAPVEQKTSNEQIEREKKDREQKEREQKEEREQREREQREQKEREREQRLRQEEAERKQREEVARAKQSAAPEPAAAVAASSSSQTTYPYSVLRRDYGGPPRTLDENKLESYLSDEEFKKVFGMNQTQFYNQKEWMIRKAKVNAKLW